ncbi:3,4-dihydroxy 2-butanone 4-phosphate synthase / GTP cyclohydrolase II [Sanguibacter gelidistatuariae]|uniref:GTP cyclohydrolase-2 n=1 Tax=Sanguibacter gelidistatuariae TaxID=1814289 RepID=A0A1G6JJ54_9MICO|nr:GTP cyclohydrolase II [Sanguibacter gelidistatuariae]SDC18769.1 3,4-dihydroxy 2-butanone 4-phosphate synthase / GTP cyclohydrolase II [Sanguibacter gelidistatuariae]
MTAAGGPSRLASIEVALDELRAGRPVLVADSPDRENEADVIFAASNVSSEWVAWTIRHSSGYLCAPMPAARADALALPLMVPHSQDPRRTAYTVTVDAATGVTTGISALDRTRTLGVLADPASGPVDLIRPGHVLPLRAVAGGVLHRAGHTEAAVDLVRLAGLGEVAGIAELVNDDGTMMRMDDSARLAEREGLVLITIADLIAWRLVNDPAVVSHDVVPEAVRVKAAAVADLPTEHGLFRIHGFRDVRTGAEHVALVPAAPTAPSAVPIVRVHSECLTGDAFGSLRCDCGPQLSTSLKVVAVEGGAVVYLRGHEGRGIGLLAKIAAYQLQDAGRDTVEANLELGWPADRREYGAAAAILAELGLERIRLLTNNPAKAVGLTAHGITVTETVGIEVGHTPENEHYLRTKKMSMGHLLHTITADPPTPLVP